MCVCVCVQIANDVAPSRTLQPPGVRTLCIYGTNITTPVGLTFPLAQRGNVSSFDTVKLTVTNDGDGTVAREGLNVCAQWPNVSVYPIFNMSHGGVMFDPRSISLFIANLYT